MPHSLPRAKTTIRAHPEPGPSAGQSSELVCLAPPGGGRGVGEPQGRGRGSHR